MKLSLIAAIAALLALPAAAQDGVQIVDPYARVIGPSGAVYFRIENHAAADDVLLSASSPDAGMAMLMVSGADAKGVMQMKDASDGFVVPAAGEFLLASGAAHVMLMDLTHPVKAGDRLTLTLTFKNAGAVEVSLPVDNARRTEPGKASN